jgi:hypothetical protein
MITGGFDGDADGEPDLTEAFFVLEFAADTATVEIESDEPTEVVVLSLTGVRDSEVGREDLVVRTDDWGSLHHAVLAALGDDPYAEERERRWARFSGQLRCSIAVLDPDEFIVLSTPLGRFVQVMAQDHEIRVETVSNQFLPEPWRLPVEDLDLLEDLGWEAPTHPMEEDSRHHEGSPNHWMDLDETTPADMIANILVRTLREVHGASEPEDLTYLAADTEGHRIFLPTLGLSRTDIHREAA